MQATFLRIVKPLGNLLALLLICNPSLVAQKFDWPKVVDTLKFHLEANHYRIDPKAKAVYIFRSTNEKDAGHYYINKVESVVKIFDVEQTADLQKVSIPYFKTTEIKEIKAVTYNLQDGSVVATEVAANQFKTEEIDNDEMQVSFEFNNVRKGSILQFTYTLKKHYSNRMWQVQENYPVLMSMLSLQYPYFENTLLSFLNGYIRPRKVANKNELFGECSSCTYISEKETKTDEIFIRKNIPAFKEEALSNSFLAPYQKVGYMIMSSMNYDFNIFRYHFKSTPESWENRYKQLKESNDFLDGTVKQIIQGKNDSLERSKALFDFVQRNYVVDKYDEARSVQQVFKNKKGDANMINFLLVAMLQKADLNTKPVYLKGPRETSSSVLPESSKKVVAYCSVNNVSYLLDASEKLLPFGLIAPNYYYGKYVIANMDSPLEAVIDVLNPEKRTIIVNMQPAANDQNFSVKVDDVLGTNESWRLRKQWFSDSIGTRAKILDGLQLKLGKIITPKDLQFTIENLNNIELPLKLHCGFEVHIDPNVKDFSFSPFFFKLYDVNPLPPMVDRIQAISFPDMSEFSYFFTLNFGNKFFVSDYPSHSQIEYGDPPQIFYKSIFANDKSLNLIKISSVYRRAIKVFPKEASDEMGRFFGDVINDQNRKITITQKH